MEVLGGGEALILKNKFKVNKFHASLRVETAKPLSTAHEYIKGGGEPLYSLKVFYLVSNEPGTTYCAPSHSSSPHPLNALKYFKRNRLVQNILE